MARRKKEEGLLDLLVLLPWWLTLAVGLVLAIVLHGRQAPADFSRPEAVKGVVTFIGLHVLKWACLAASFVSGMLALKRNVLFASAKDIETIRNMSCWDFEKLVAEAYRRQGYSVEQRGGAQADGGVDVLLRGNGQKIIVQCKQWRTWKVGVSVVREMYGVMVGAHADRVVIVASGRFTQDAEAFARGKPIDLIDGKALVRLIRDVKAAQSPSFPAYPEASRQTVAACRVAEFPCCPVCGSSMVLRTARRGANAGNSFWGCPKYPACKGIVNVES